MQDTTATHPPELEQAIAAISLADLLGPDYVDRTRVGVRYAEISRVAARFGYRFVLEHGNVYGKVRFELIDNTLAPILRVVTRSDVAAVYGSRRAA